MKKAKILAVFGILLAMGITACNKGGDEQSQEAPASQEQGGSQEHTHEFGEWHQTVAPTCEGKGQEERECACGEKETRDVKALGHDFGEWTVKTAATCTADGQEERACKRAGCDKKETRVIKAAHDWDAEQAVAAGTDPANQVGYKLAVCKKGDAVKADLKATDAKFYKGSIKSGTPSGYFKLNSKNDKAYWKFTVAGTKMYKGMLYQLGAMDSFSSNTDKSYAHTSSSSSSTKDLEKGNFDVVVNGVSLDKKQWIEIPFETLLAEGEDSSAMGDNYSPICLCPIGEAVIVPGLNEITYERLGSYNLIISDLVFIGSEYNHTHTTATDWSSDDNQHWHACTAPGCPLNGKVDLANHTYPTENEWTINKPATCTEDGERQHTCTVCHKVVKEVIKATGHKWVADPDHPNVAPSCTAKGVINEKCENAGCTATRSTDHYKDVGVYAEKIDSKAADATTGAVAYDIYNCKSEGHEHSGYVWSAADFNAELTTARSDVQPDVSDAANKGIRFGDGAAQYKDKNADAKGTHLVYKVFVPAGVTYSVLSVKSTNRAKDTGGIFAFNPSDNTKGYEKVSDEFVQPTHRYGLVINGERVPLGYDDYPTDKNDTSNLAWFSFPAQITLVPNQVNEIEIFSMGGYRLYMKEFRLSGMPKGESSHVHNGGETWVTDDNNHWHACTADGCLAEGGIYDKEAHDWNDMVQTKAPTCSEAGAGTKECKVCHKVMNVVIPALGHGEFTKGTAVKNSKDQDVTPIECPVCHDEGFEMALTDCVGSGEIKSGKVTNGKKLEYTFKVGDKVGQVQFIMKAKCNSEGHDNPFTKDGDTSTDWQGNVKSKGKYTLKAGATEGEITAAGKQLGADFGATHEKAVWFEMGRVEIKAAEVDANGEVVVSIEFPTTQDYRHVYEEGVRIVFLPAA